MPLPLVLIAPNALPSNIIIIQASFEPGELKKMLAVETGLQPQEQRLIFMGKERDNSDFFNITGVKDKSKIVLIEDPSRRERKYIEMKRNAKIEFVCKAVFKVSTEVDKLANQDALLRVHNVIANAGTGDAKKDKVSARLLILKSQVGSLIGKGGSNVEKLRNESGAHIKVQRTEKMPSCAMCMDDLVEEAAAVGEDEGIPDEVPDEVPVFALPPSCPSSAPHI